MVRSNQESIETIIVLMKDIIKEGNF